MRLIVTAVALATASATLVVSTTASQTANATEERTTHIVKLDQAPLASYRGGVAGLAPTSPAVTGDSRLQVGSAASTAYLAYLDARHRAVRASVAAATGRAVAPAFEYHYAFNGMALELTEPEAARVSQLPGVASVRPEFTRRVTTDAGPEWIGAPSVWAGDATGDSPGTKGEGVVVGVIDTGVNHDHPSFAEVGGDGYEHDNPRNTYYGACDPVTGLPFCNDKLIGAHDFTGTSPMDDHGHGSHTASTVAGNAHTAALAAPTTSVEREISGVAPHANVITYKACLAVGSCLSPSLTAAIDQAVADQVDVINYSIGGGPNDPWDDADSEAFLNAREAGVVVAASAGNSGPGAETVGSPANSPWVMSVGASTHNRAFGNNVTGLSGGDGTPPGDLAGAGLTAGYGPKPIVHARDYGDKLCGAPFAPGTFDGQIVVCDRGVNPRVEKGRNVEVGGAGGMILVNTEADGESTVADPHELPAVHLGHTVGKQLTDWLAQGEGHEGRISGTEVDEDPANGDVMAGFSSRGANAPVPGVIKPDVTAPGVDVLAAFNADPTTGPEYGVISGTSMSSPHAAGSAALVRAVHPGWTPAEVQSALSSTAVTDVVKDDGATAADPFDMGGGRIDLTRAAEAGLALHVTPQEYVAANPATGGDPTTLNLATLADDQCAGECSWTRTVTNVTGARARWGTATEMSEGVSISVKPRRFTLDAGESLTLNVTADASEATTTDWAFGALNLTSAAAPDQRFPVAVLPGGSAREVPIEAAGSSGSKVVELEAPVDISDFTSTVSGLQQGRQDRLRVEQDPTPLDPYDTAVGTKVVTMEVEAGGRLIAGEITGTTANDLDLFVGRDADGDGAPDSDEEVCRSASEIAQESCAVTDPEPGTYWVMVQNWLSGTAVDEVDLVTTAVPGDDLGNLTVVGPDRVKAGEPMRVRLDWDEPEMTPGTTWNALVELGSEPSHPTNVGTMLVRINRPAE